MDSSQRILLLDTSGKVGTVGLATPSGVTASEHLPGQMRHAAELMPTLARMLDAVGWAADSLTDVFLTAGPGSFTGLRLGVSVARTLGWAIGARIIALGTMPVLARNALSITPAPGHVAVMLDAKRGQVFAAAFELHDSQYRPVIDACLDAPAAFLGRCPRPLALLGEGLPLHEPAVAQPNVTVLPPEFGPSRAEHILSLGLEHARANRYTPAGDLVPLYVRRPEMEERWEQRQTRTPKSE